MCHLTVCPLKEHPAAKVALILLNFDNPAERSKKCSGTDDDGGYGGEVHSYDLAVSGFPFENEYSPEVRKWSRASVT